MRVPISGRIWGSLAIVSPYTMLIPVDHRFSLFSVRSAYDEVVIETGKRIMSPGPPVLLIFLIHLRSRSSLKIAIILTHSNAQACDLKPSIFPVRPVNLQDLPE